jgi:LytS/YehU family sensor histidine kinase
MSDPDKARDLLVRLSRLLRATLIAADKPSTDLAEEMGLIRDYLELEGAGLGERLRFQDQIPSGPDGSSFPPLLLFSLVEGAVRRGVGMRKSGATITLIRPRPNCFRIEVDPPVPGGEAEFPEWPDPVWRERLGMQPSRRDTLRVETERDGSVRAVELELGKEAE